MYVCGGCGAKSLLVAENRGVSSYKFMARGIGTAKITNLPKTVHLENYTYRASFNQAYRVMPTK